MKTGRLQLRQGGAGVTTSTERCHGAPSEMLFTPSTMLLHAHIFIFCHIYNPFHHLVQWLLLVFTYLPIARCGGGYIFTSDWTWRLKSPFPAFKHWSNVGQLAFRPLVLSTCPLRQCIHERVHPCGLCFCLSIYIYLLSGKTWNSFSRMSLTRPLRAIFLLIWQRTSRSD